MLYTKEKQILHETYHSLNKPTVILVEGDYGMGKTHLIENYLSAENIQMLKIKQKSDWDFLNSIVNGISNFNLQRKSFDSQTSKLSSESFLKKELLDIIASDGPLCVLIDDITAHQHNLEVISFLNDFLTFLLKSDFTHPVLILIEASCDKLTEAQTDFLAQMKTLCPKKHQIKLENKHSDNLSNYFKSLFYEPITIEELDVNHILKASFYNPLFIKRLVGYLKETNIIIFDERTEVWTCNTIDVNLVSNYLKIHIHKRYENLDNNLKEILRKSSYTGFNIDTKLLEKPIGILRAELQLNRIEQLSNLILKEKTSFQFENDEVYCIIEEYADKEEKIQWHSIIAEHLREMLNYDNKKEIIAYLYKVAQHYEMAEYYSQAFQFYIHCITEVQRQLDFSNVITIGLKALELYKILPENIYYTQYLWNSIANAHLMTANYQESLLYYRFLSESSTLIYDIDYITYNYAYAYYNAGFTEEAYTMLEDLRIHLNENREKEDLYIESLIILSGICDQLGNHVQSQRYYNEGVDKSKLYKDKTKYYRLLRCSNMFLVSDQSIPLIHEAYIYFKEADNLLEQAFCAHNLSMEYIFNLDFEQAATFISKSQGIFESICSNNICFSLSALGNLSSLKKDYITALEFYDKALLFSFDDFITIAISLNISQCYRKLNKSQSAQQFLIKCESLMRENASDLYVQYRNISFIKAMIYLDEGKEREALVLLEKAYYYETDIMNYHYYDSLLAKMIIDLSKFLGKTHSKKYDEYNNCILKGHLQILYEDHVLWTNLEFWGV